MYVIMCVHMHMCVYLNIKSDIDIVYLLQLLCTLYIEAMPLAEHRACQFWLA